jgi:hypothetical protein
MVIIITLITLITIITIIIIIIRVILMETSYNLFLKSVNKKVKLIIIFKINLSAFFNIKKKVLIKGSMFFTIINISSLHNYF